MPHEPNRLIYETSPYLLQHAHNPVQWYAWGQEALARAQAEDKPILLSIGYSACHWCHVMERESFENEQIAQLMNDEFISIKVDREERPDLDQIYMAAVQMMSGSGGWPLTVFLLPDGKPFYGGTYFPPEDRYGRPGFPRVLATMSHVYRTKRDEVLENARFLVEQLNQAARQQSNDTVDIRILEEAHRALASRFDPREGGFGGAPKFPAAMTIDFLLRYHERQGDEQSRHMSSLTLDKMAYGGMYDQVGGGFHRYSTDEHWLVPHFEKMLYDNALLARVYLDAWLLTGKPLYKRVTEGILDFTVREMRSPNGGFYSTQDADSEGVEGLFYVWSAEEFNSVVGSDAELLSKYFGVSEHGNFEHRNILNISRPPEIFCKLEQLAAEELDRKVGAARRRLYEVREKRVKPARDEKILTDWNGLMLRAFADAGFHLHREDYLEVARENAEFILATLWDGERLLHSFKDGRARFNGYLDDYANFADGLLSLYEATFDYRWMESTLMIVNRMIELFKDSAAGGFHFTAANHETLIARSKDFFDNATPSGNSVAADVLVRLASLLDRNDYRRAAEDVFGAALPLLRQYPAGFGRMLGAIDFYIGPSREIALAGDSGELLDVLRLEYLPRSVIAAGTDTRIPLLANRPLLDGKPTAYICENYRCKTPVNDVQSFRRQLEA